MLIQSLEPIAEVSTRLLVSELLVAHHRADLNCEQRKRLAIGVELAAKPITLLLLDQPLAGEQH